MRDIILITGPIADGKTTLINGLQDEFQKRGISFAPRPVSDADHLMSALEWDKRSFGGIYHQSGESQFDFVVTKYPIQRFVFSHFFHQVWLYPAHEGMVFAELAAGVNGHTSGHPAAGVDYSYTSMVRELMDGRYVTDWVHRIAAVIHPTSEFAQRDHWNRTRRENPPTEDAIHSGRASWHVPDEVLLNTAGDDFQKFENFLTHHGVSPSRIVKIRNDGTPSLIDEAMEFITRVHTSQEGGRYRKEGGR